jgi:LysM domain
MAVKDTLTQKAGPLPVWAWAGILVVLVAGFMIYEKKKNMNAQAAQATNQAGSSNLGVTPVSNLTVAAEPMPYQAGDTFVNVSGGGASSTATATGTGGTGGTGTSTTVNNPPTPTPPTPKPPTPPVVTPKPPAATLPAAPKPAPPKPATQSVTVCPYPAWCGSLWGIALHFYGNGALWPTIYAANKGLIGANPNLIHPGQVLTIPPKPA